MAFVQGFVDRCAGAGVDAEQLVKAAVSLEGPWEYSDRMMNAVKKNNLHKLKKHMYNKDKVKDSLSDVLRAGWNEPAPVRPKGT